VNYICSITARSPSLNNELPNNFTPIGNTHVVHRLKHNFLAKELVPIIKQKSKGNIYSVRPDKKSHSKPHIMRIYVANESNMGFQEVSNIFAYHAQLSFPNSSALEWAPTLSPKRFRRVRNISKSSYQLCHVGLSPGSCRMDFHEILHLSIFRKSVEKI
jgi:hypothetical protein